MNKSLELLTVQELATLLKVPVSTLYAWRYGGKGPPARRIGRHVRYRADDVARWLESQPEKLAR